MLNDFPRRPKCWLIIQSTRCILLDDNNQKSLDLLYVENPNKKRIGWLYQHPATQRSATATVPIQEVKDISLYQEYLIERLTVFLDGGRNKSFDNVTPAQNAEEPAEPNSNLPAPVGTAPPDTPNYGNIPNYRFTQ